MLLFYICDISIRHKGTDDGDGQREEKIPEKREKWKVYMYFFNSLSAVTFSYSQTCLKGPLKGPKNSDLLMQQVN